MKTMSAYGRTLPEAYSTALYLLFTGGETSEAEWQDRNTEMKECSMTMVVEHPLKEPMISKFFIGGAADLERYRQEMLDGVLDFMVGHGWDYTYHDRMVRFPAKEGYKDQIRAVVDELRRCPYSRRAVISIRTADDIGSSDPACLQHIQYFIRGGKLTCHVLFRSNDAVKATFMNAFALILLQKRIADELGVEVGEYVHTANSFHCYKQDYGLLGGYVNRRDDYSYEYEGFYKDMMDEAKPYIAEMVEKLRASTGEPRESDDDIR